MTYKLDYDGEAPAQLDAPLGEATALLKTDAEMPRPALRLSPVAQTVVAAVLVAVAFFSLEKFGPRDWRPSSSRTTSSCETSCRGRPYRSQRNTFVMWPWAAMLSGCRSATSRRRRGSNTPMPKP